VSIVEAVREPIAQEHKTLLQTAVGLAAGRFFFCSGGAVGTPGSCSAPIRVRIAGMTQRRFAVREARVADVPALAALGAELIRFHQRLDPQRFEILSPQLEAGYSRFLEGRLNDARAVVLLAECELVGEGSSGRSQEVVGYAFGQIEGPSWPDLLGVHGRFHDLMVRGDRRGLGVGTALVRSMLEHLRARGAPRVVLMTAWANGNARGFFEKLGFRPTMVEMTANVTS